MFFKYERFLNDIVLITVQKNGVDKVLKKIWGFTCVYLNK